MKPVLVETLDDRKHRIAVDELIRIASMINHRLDIERANRVWCRTDTYCCGKYHQELKIALARVTA